MGRTKVFCDSDDKNVAATILYKKDETSRLFFEFDSASGTYSDPVPTEEALHMFAAGALISAVGQDSERHISREDDYDDFLELCTDPLAALLVDATSIGADTDLLGKVVSDLETGVVVADGIVSGNLKYVTGYTGFSGDPEEQSGNYLALKFHFEDVTGETIKVATAKGTEVTLDSDGILVYRMIGNPAEEWLKVTITKSGCETIVKEFSLSGLVLAKPE